MTTRITVDLDGLTWGELIAFVHAARSTGVDTKDSVAQVSDLLDDSTVTAFELSFPRPLPAMGPSIAPPVADEIRALIQLLSDRETFTEEIRERLAVVQALVG
jgi:hypothetical protein